MTQSPKIKLNVLAPNTAVSLDEVLALPDTPFRPTDVPVFERREQSFEGRARRTSNYTIYVELPGDANRMLLVHGYTGAYDRVSRGVVGYLRSLEKAAAKPLHGSWSPEPGSDGAVTAISDGAIAQLKKRGYLTPMTDDEEVAFFTGMSVTRQHAAVHNAPSYVVMPTYQCNLRCAYCFQDHMRTDPALHHLLRTMDRAMVDRIFQGMARIDAAHGIAEGAGAPRSIILFGGEPLLAESRPTIEYIVEQACARGAARLSAITNATDLHAYEDLLGPGKIGQLQITVDGPPRVHDQRRIYADGSGSFARIARNVTMALERGVLVSIRMNIDRTNLPLLPELAEELIAQGWDQHRGFSAYVAPVHGAPHQPGKKTTYTSWQLNQAMTELKEQHPSVRRIGGSDDALLERALLADALCDADLALDGRLASILEGEAQYLVGQRLRSATGGWRYFANLPELPPDADDLGQVMQALLRAGRRDDVARHAEAPLRVLLRDQRHDDGSFDTWIVPATGRSPLEDRHAALVERVWGTGADCDVMPNLLYALHLYDDARFADAIHRGAAYLEAHQRDDGSWASRWYAGPYYAIHVNLRMFAAVAPASPAVGRALAHLRAAQRSDGGWGLDGAASDPLSTALALLGLAAVCTDERTDDPADRARAARGIAALRAMGSDGAWPAHNLIFKGVGAFHGSRTLTTTFVLKAALAWRA